jgi:hypothetical protein
MQVSLFDLMFYYDKSETLRTRYLEVAAPGSYRSMGFELPHNIIVFDTTLYGIVDKKKTRQINQLEYDSFGHFAKSGIDIALPRIDYRTKPLFLYSGNVETIIPGSSKQILSELTTKFGLGFLQQSDYYEKLKAKGFKIWDKDALLKPNDTYDFYSQSIYALNLANAANTWDDYPDQWSVAAEDDYIYKFEDDTTMPQNSAIILCNRDVVFEQRFLKDNTGLLAYNGICVNYNNLDIWKNFFRYYGATSSLIPSSLNDIGSFFSVNSSRVQNLDPIIEYMLKHCYLWIKCSFFADYVDYRDFNQSLNQKSKTIFNNLMLTNLGDYKRYEEYYTLNEDGLEKADKELNTRPYFPSITPSIDLVVPRFITTGDIEELIELGDDPDGKIGAIPATPFELNSNGITSQARSVPPPVWFDPESRQEANDYAAMPIVYPKDGNAIIDGRIISPTIDELWQMIKGMIAGRKADTDTTDPYNDAGYPVGTDEKATSFDSRQKIIEHNIYDYATTENKHERLGDPLIIKYDFDKNNPHYEVEQWINNPSKIRYTIIDELKALNDSICYTGDASLAIKGLSSITHPKDYLPYDTIPSLRELEALLKGIRWNLSYFFEFYKKNGVYNGALGRKNDDTQRFNAVAGSLYQLHKNYEFDTAHPNTVYDERKTRTPADATIKGTGLGKITSDMFGASQDMVPAHTVFLSAAGTWQSVSQCMNVRIRNDETW